MANNGKAISDSNERYRSMVICKELTAKYDLTMGESKKAVHRNRLRGGDKLKYELYDTIKAVLPNVRSWQEFEKALLRQGVNIHFKTKGNTSEVQGIIFEKDGVCFNGSKVDRAFSYSKLNYQITQQAKAQQEPQLNASIVNDVGEMISETLDSIDLSIAPSGGADPHVTEHIWQNKLRAAAKKNSMKRKIRR